MTLTPFSVKCRAFTVFFCGLILGGILSSLTAVELIYCNVHRIPVSGEVIEAGKLFIFLFGFGLVGLICVKYSLKGAPRISIDTISSKWGKKGFTIFDKRGSSFKGRKDQILLFARCRLGDKIFPSQRDIFILSAPCLSRNEFVGDYSTTLSQKPNRKSKSKNIPEPIEQLLEELLDKLSGGNLYRVVLSCKNKTYSLKYVINYTVPRSEQLVGEEVKMVTDFFWNTINKLNSAES